VFSVFLFYEFPCFFIFEFFVFLFYEFPCFFIFEFFVFLFYEFPCFFIFEFFSELGVDKPIKNAQNPPTQKLKNKKAQSSETQSTIIL